MVQPLKGKKLKEKSRSSVAPSREHDDKSHLNEEQMRQYIGSFFPQPKNSENVTTLAEQAYLRATRLAQRVQNLHNALVKEHKIPVGLEESTPTGIVSQLEGALAKLHDATELLVKIKVYIGA